MGPLDGEEQLQARQEGFGTRCCAKIRVEVDGRLRIPQATTIGGAGEAKINSMGQAGGCWLKVNTDAGFDQMACTKSSRVVIRDEGGLVVAATTRWFDDVSDTLTAEALGAKEGLELAQEIGAKRIILEVDN
jgi:hypothetical protein